MLNDHFNEISADTAIGELTDRPEPDFSRYMEEQRYGKLLFVTARIAPDRTLVGYMGMNIERHKHYKQIYVAIDDLHYLMPKYRNLGLGKKMIQATEGMAKTGGCKIFIMRCSASSKHGFIFESMGYVLKDLVYMKDIRNVSEQ